METYELIIVLVTLLGDGLSVIGGLLVLGALASLGLLLNYKVFGNDLRSLIIVCLMMSGSSYFASF